MGKPSAPAAPRSAQSYRQQAEALHQSAMLAEFNGRYELAREHREAAVRALQAALAAERQGSSSRSAASREESGLEALFP